MTVCIAALAERARAIVLVSDRALTFHDGYSPAMQGDTDVNKMLPIGKTGWIAMTAGDGGLCDKVVSELSNRVTQNPEIARSAIAIAACAESAYQETYEKLTIETVLQPRLLTKDLWVARSRDLLPLNEGIVRDIRKDLNEFSIGCHFLICGFDENGKAHIISLQHPGVAKNQTNSGYSAIGTGAQVAIGRLLWQETQRSDPLEVVFYEAFDAKAHAEKIQGVGYAWASRIILPGKILKPPVRIARIIEDVFNLSTISPFVEPWKLPRRWKERLRAYRKSVMRSVPAKRAWATRKKR